MPSKPLAPDSITAVQANVLQLFRQYGAMDDYLLIERYRQQFDYGVSESTPRTRRRELADQGHLYATSLKTLSPQGRSLTVWSLTPGKR